LVSFLSNGKADHTARISKDKIDENNSANDKGSVLTLSYAGSCKTKKDQFEFLSLGCLKHVAEGLSS
jgi:hypothetical protein